MTFNQEVTSAAGIKTEASHFLSHWALNMSRRVKEEYCRFYSVTETRTHEKGHTEYKVTARFVSKRRPEDVKEVAVWSRFSELKKLHGELAFTHRNLFRKQEEFPPFPRSQVFGRFDEGVIEERRKAAEVMLQFTTSIPALYNSPQLKDFFMAGEVTLPLEPTIDSSSGPLPPPLIPLPKRRASDCEPADEEEGREAPLLPQDLSTEPRPTGEPEVAVEAFNEMAISPGEEEEDLSDPELDEPAGAASPVRTLRSVESQEEFDSLFDSVAEEQERAAPPLTEQDLEVFDPCYEPGKSTPCGDHSELFYLALSSPDAETSYLIHASNELTVAMEREKDGEFSAAIRGFRAAVDLLITGVQEDPDPVRKESVMRKTAQYLRHAEMLVEAHASPSHKPFL